MLTVSNEKWTTRDAGGEEVLWEVTPQQHDFPAWIGVGSLLAASRKDQCWI
jgi:hypothetical protein